MSYSTFEKTGVSSTDRTFAMAIWVSSFFTTFIGPLIIWLIKKDDSSFVDYHGKEYFNFLISYVIYYIIAFILVFVLIGALALIIIGIMHFIFTIIAAVKAFDGQLYRVPFIWHFLR